MIRQPQIGDRVAVRYLGPKPGYDTPYGRLVLLGSERPTLAVEGTLGVETDDNGRVRDLVIEGDGSATFIPRNDIVSVEVLS